VVEEPARARQRVHAALLARAFERDASAGVQGRWLYRGTLDPSDLNVPIRICIDDWDFVNPPLIWIDPDYPIAGRLLPHFLGQNRILCYVAQGSIVLDRYDPAGVVLLCLKKAEDLIRNAMRGRLNADFAGEFEVYWRGTWLLVDLPDGFTGRAKLQQSLGLKAERKPLILSTGKTWLRKCADAASEESSEDVIVLEVDEPLSLDPTAPWPPENLTTMNAWLDWSAPHARGVLERAIAESENWSGRIALRAPNGLFLYDATLPRNFIRQEFRSRRNGIPALLKFLGSGVPVSRSRGVHADAVYVFSRNLGSMNNLANKRILLIGCGTIGSFLAQQLAQCGAGAGEGSLSLVDDDALEPGNLGRHLLGAPYLNMNKAEACAAFLSEQLPLLAIEGYPEDVRNATSLRWDRYDLIIDATGEEALSVALNQRAIERRPHSAAHLFVWLEGNGAIAQAIWTDDAEHACYKCLKPELSGPPRYRTLKPGIDVETIENQSCGDPSYQPFPVSRSVAAAALVCDLALDWANGRPGARYRSITLDPARAFQVPRGSPGPHPRCPACATSA
jgi:molybdopterin/thiamine biosynthesis adenylyltransferase